VWPFGGHDAYPGATGVCSQLPRTWRHTRPSGRAAALCVSGRYFGLTPRQAVLKPHPRPIDGVMQLGGHSQQSSTGRAPDGRACCLDQRAVHERMTISDFNKHAAKSVLPDVPEHALSSQRQIRLHAVAAEDKNFWKQLRGHSRE
jgi:hypothetical protein